MPARFLPRWEVADVTGAVVAVDVIRAFTTAAYAFAAGARHIFLVDSVDEAVAFKAANPGVLTMGENRGRRPPEFDFSNSPVEIAAADLDGRVLFQRTSAGTRGVIAARSATRLWCASLVCASATAAAVRTSGLGAPTYVITGAAITDAAITGAALTAAAITGAAITGRYDDRPSTGADDLAAAELIERARLGSDLDAARTIELIARSDEATRTLALGQGHSDPDDIVYATRVDAFDFAMEVRRDCDRLRLDQVQP
ncbi:MAG TPA: 2-phosphosulfolactate phosphatase [Ilumatobacteraceae bacterium]|nr:2-phosphosulfolactate phosphatase [Ilumatobacteraceae bacterium]